MRQGNASEKGGVLLWQTGKTAKAQKGSSGASEISAISAMGLSAQCSVRAGLNRMTGFNASDKRQLCICSEKDGGMLA